MVTKIDYIPIEFGYSIVTAISRKRDEEMTHYSKTVLF